MPSLNLRRSILAGAITVGLAAAAVPALAHNLGSDGKEPEKKQPTEQAVTKLLKNMSLEEKIGQLFVGEVYGQDATTVTEQDAAQNMRNFGVRTPAEVVNKYHLGGVIYFEHNVGTPTQLATMSNGLQDAAKIPLFVSVDQEGGTVARIGEPLTQLPGNAAIGATRKADNAYTAAKVNSQELHALGINQNYAPDADVNINAHNPVIGVRSFGEDPTLVSDMTSAQVRGYREGGVIATAKHFPGHGDTAVDSHYGLPVITHTKEQWKTLDKPPFEAAIKENIDMIMSAHLVVPALDPSEEVATLSQPILTGQLRKELGFDGVIVTDALRMDGITKKYPDAAIPPVKAINAGADQLLLPANMDDAFNGLLTAVHKNEISEKRIDESVTRLLTLKEKRGILSATAIDTSTVNHKVGTAENRAAIAAITDSSTTLVKNDAGTLPLAASGRSTLVTGWGETTTQSLAEKIDARGTPADALATGISPTKTQIDEALREASHHEVIVVTTHKPWVDGQTSQQTLVNALLKTGKTVIVVGVRDPYDIAYLSAAPTFLATYSYTDVALESLTKVLFGEVSPTGVLPVTIPSAEPGEAALFKAGHGLHY
ncbi:MAG: glycoside hydrolase family 3 protein [Corynebacteriales bacterium]|nr:glycoside hydrolase family 3 protein [Mycobacteriales bacterium]